MSGIAEVDYDSSSESSSEEEDEEEKKKMGVEAGKKHTHPKISDTLAALGFIAEAGNLLKIGLSKVSRLS